MNNSLEKKLLINDVKPTTMRLLVLQKLMERTSATSLSDLEDSFEMADRSTLFRTLKTFEEHKLIHSVEDGTGTTKYALCLEGCECNPEDLHVHFHCKSCQETFCINQVTPPKVNLPTNFSLEEINMVVNGICSNCKK